MRHLVRRTTKQRGDDGSVLLLIIGLSVVLMLLVAVVVDVSAVILAKRGLSATADGAAIAAAQQPSRAGIDGGGLESERLPLDLAQVQAVVEDYRLDARETQRGLEMSAVLDGPSTAVVTAQRVVHLPFSGWLEVGNPTVTAVSRARSPLSN